MTRVADKLALKRTTDVLHYILDGLICLVILWAIFIQERKTRSLRARLKHRTLECDQLHADLRFWQNTAHQYKRKLDGDLGSAIKKARGGEAPVAMRSFA